MTAEPLAAPRQEGQPEPVLSARGLTKAFPNVRALTDLSIDVFPGQVLALLGENGAGKSTFLKILNGDYQPDAGTLVLDGKEVAFSNPLQAHRAGVRVVYQEPEIIGGVNVAENIYVGELPQRGGVVDRRELNRRARDDLARYGFLRALRPQEMGENLSAAQRQLVEVMRALKAGVRVLALDEPTSSLTNDEVDRLFTLVRQLRSQGVAVIYVSHRIKEILELADRVAIMRDSRLVAVRPATELTEAEIIRLMVGREWSDVVARRRATQDRVVLRVEDVESNWHHGVSLEVRAGEVVALAGLIGAGRSELAKIIFGDLPRDSGRIYVDGKHVSIGNPEDAVQAGIGFAPEDRKREGLVLSRSVVDNIAIAILRRLSRFGFVRAALSRRVATQYVDGLRIRTPSIDQEVGKLSGGNQQKVVLARWLAAHPKVLILDEPTRGIDVGAKAEIYRLIDDLANEGLGILMISSELPEVLSLADRIYVMRQGSISGEIPAEGATEEKILSLAISTNAAAVAAGPEPAEQGLTAE